MIQSTPKPQQETVGVVLGSQDATPLEFWIGVQGDAVVQLDELVQVTVTLEATGEVVEFYGIVDEVRKRYEGSQFDTDAFHASKGTLPVEVSYAAHVQVTRIDPEVFVPPDPGTEVQVVRGEAFQKALYFDQMDKRIPIGITRAGEPIFANFEFLDGTRGAHLSISGVSGVATKTSYATFLLYSIFHSDVLGSEAANTKALIFNVKGEDLLWLDHANQRLDDRARREYEFMGLEPGPFKNVGLYAPAKPQPADEPFPDVSGRTQGIQAYVWTLREFAKDRLLRFVFAESDDARSQITFVIDRVERYLERAAKEGDKDDPGLDIDGHRVTSFRDLTDLLDGDLLDKITHGSRIASGTLDAFRRRLHAAGRRMGHLIRGVPAARGHGVDIDRHKVTVIDIHGLHSTAQMFVVGVFLKKMMDKKERLGTSRPLYFIVLDELNKYAPRSGWSPISDVLLDIAERGRSLGVALFGAQQTASEVERRVVSNAAIKIVGRLDAAEAERGEYGFLTQVSRVRATLLQPGSMIVAQPQIPTPILLHFPFPSWATRQSEAQDAKAREARVEKTFSRFGDDDDD